MKIYIQTDIDADDIDDDDIIKIARDRGLRLPIAAPSTGGEPSYDITDMFDDAADAILAAARQQDITHLRVLLSRLRDDLGIPRPHMNTPPPNASARGGKWR